MKPFNLQEALSGKAVMLRDGRKAYVRHHEMELPVDESICLTGFRTDGCPLTWCENGDYYTSSGTDDYDIIGMYPETRIINGFEVPAPETEEPENDTRYYIPSPSVKHFYSCPTWEDHGMDKLWLERGLVFLNKEEAIATAKAMLGIDPNSRGRIN